MRGTPGATSWSHCTGRRWRGANRSASSSRPSGRRGHAYHLFVLRALNGGRDDLLRGLQAKGIGAGIHYPIAIHQQEAFKPLLKSAVSFPVTEQLASQIFSLPLCPDLRDDEARIVIDALTTTLESVPVEAGR